MRESNWQGPSGADRADDSVLWSVAVRSFGRRVDPVLAQAWKSLRSGAPPLLEPDVLALVGRLAGRETMVAAAYQGEALAAVLPLVRTGRVLASLRSEHLPECDLIGRPDAVPWMWRALLAMPGWDELHLFDLPASSPVAVQLPGLALRDLAVTSVRPASRSPWMALPGFEARLSSKHRQNLRRWERKLEGIELERLTTFSRQAMSEAMAIEAMAWKGAAGTGIGSDERVRHFYLALARLAARRSQLSLCFLRGRGRRVAFALVLEDQGKLYALKTGYDPTLTDLALGHLLFREIARDAERRGMLELHFLGKDEEWKRRWTSTTRDHVDLVVYRPSARGVASLIARELVRPRLPAGVVAALAEARREGARRRVPCQRRDRVGAHGPIALALGRVGGGLGVRSGLRRVLAAARAPAAPAELGAPSAFAPGQWVRVLDAERVRAGLGPGDKLRGLAFIPAQWNTCGRSYRVQQSVRRLVDDERRMRPVARTVLLEGVSCDIGGHELGCGRHCPLMFRDEWLEPAEPAAEPADPYGPYGPVGWARVRSVEEIRATLDDSGRRDGVTFMAEMGRFAGQRLPIVRRLSRVFELDRWVPTRGPIYLLDGARCAGEALGALGPCHRACSLLWHGDWLELLADATPTS